MRFIQYVLLIVPSIVMTLLAYLLAPVLALLVGEDGRLPWQLNWFEPVDNPVIGDSFWSAEHPNYGAYRLALTYMWRNPAQGFDQWIKADVNEKTAWKCIGNIGIADGEHGVAGYYLVRAAGYFHFSYVLHCGFGHCLAGGYGWRLNSLVKGYSHPTLGQYVFTPLFRIQKFT